MNTQENGYSRQCWNVLRIGVTLLLWAAAWFKAVNIVELVASDGVLNTRPMLFAAIGFEVFAGLFILTCNTVWAWRLTVAVFTVFSAVSAYAIIAGVSCNCFAKSIGPQYVLPIDLCVVGLALCWRPTYQTKQRLSLSLCAFCIVAGASAILFASKNEMRPEIGDPLQFLLADTLVGKQWPIKDTMHESLNELEEGRWLVLVLRGDCEHCKEMVREHFSNPEVHRDSERTAVFVAGQQEWGFELDRISFTPSQKFQWPHAEPFVASPAVFLLEDCRVVQAADGKEAAELLTDLLVR